MRRMILMLTVVAMVAVGGGLASAQDATMMAMQAAQQANDMAMQAAQTANQMAMQAAQQATQDAMQVDSRMSMAVQLPVTPRPVIVKLKGGVSVVLYDADPKAIVFYTTDGSLPTFQSQRYAGPIVVSAKVRVRAMAFDLAEMPSGVVSKTIRVKL
ncbi:MAG TPA: chitobiase/beta-hexosaminidase C-terminal domain-containing protein [Acidobacteriaceae bacterium]|jgi:hypothetical protein|nr:chitobiase/beta-hexosaminidase C-terminal domain-containing protein [Acidobacteriaceae bacterium]